MFLQPRHSLITSGQAHGLQRLCKECNIYYTMQGIVAEIDISSKWFASAVYYILSSRVLGVLLRFGQVCCVGTFLEQTEKRPPTQKKETNLSGQAFVLSVLRSIC